MRRDLTPTLEEVQRYQCSWRRHLLAYALAATGSAKPLHLQTQGAPGSEAPPAGGADCANAEVDMVADAEIIKSFEAKYWPTVIIPVRQQVLHDLQQQARLRQRGWTVTRSERTCSLEADTAALPGRATKQILQIGGESCGACDTEQCTNSLSQQEEKKTVQGLMAEVAGELAAELSVSSAADVQVMKCIEQMTPRRFSKSIEFAVQLQELGVTLAAAYEAKSCIRMNFAELYAHVALYYDLRMSVVAAFEGIHVTDSLHPDLSHRQVLSSQPPHTIQKRCNEAPCHGIPWRVRLNGHSVGSFRPPSEQALSDCKPPDGTPSSSPLHHGGNACVLDWNSNCACGEGACPCDSPRMTAFRFQENKKGTHDALAGGWMRFDKVYVPIEGLPEMVIHVQTHGSFLCTVTPESLAFLVQALQEPVQLVERSSILEAASREVQDVMHRNEIFMAKLLIGEIEHTSIDLCVDIPVSHQLLLPFSHKNPRCRGILLQSGAIFVDSRLQLPRLHAATFSLDSSNKAYDRYSLAITGACARRVFDCLDVERSCAAQPPSASCASTWQPAATTSSEAELPGNAAASGHESGSRTMSKGRRQSRHTPAAGQHQERQDEATANRQENTAMKAVQDTNEAEGIQHAHVEERQQDFILWPVGIEGCIDICHFASPLDLPAFRMTVQDQDFRCSSTRTRTHYALIHKPLLALMSTKKGLESGGSV